MEPLHLSSIPSWQTFSIILWRSVFCSVVLVLTYKTFISHN
jgi:hypothetical protein